MIPFTKTAEISKINTRVYVQVCENTQNKKDAQQTADGGDG